VLNGRTVAALALLASACGPSPQTTELRQAVATNRAGTALQGVAFRFAGSRGATVRLHELPSLDEVAWRFDVPALVAHRLVGFAADDDLVYALTPDSQLVALDLESGRPHVADSLVTLAAAGPDGAILLARADGSLGRISRRRAARLGTLSDAALEGLHGAANGRGVAVVRRDGARALITATAGTLSDPRAVPEGPLALAPWGDAIAVAADSGLVLIAPHRDDPDRFLRLRTVALAVTFSSSGHRIYVATDDSSLIVIDRFDLTRLGTVTLPQAATELRADPFGHWLLGRTERGLLAIPQQAGGAVRTPEGEWDEDLPAASPDGTILVRRGADVVALDAESLEPSGRVANAARDRWLIAPWDPRRPALQVATPPEGSRPAGAGQEIFVQVSSTATQPWADKLARDLVVAGLRATVLAPVGPDEMFRVVIGPYASRDEAEETGRKLGMPYWIFTRDAAPPPSP
jgi:hypothetical protein